MMSKNKRRIIVVWGRVGGGGGAGGGDGSLVGRLGRCWLVGGGSAVHTHTHTTRADQTIINGHLAVINAALPLITPPHVAHCPGQS